MTNYIFRVPLVAFHDYDVLREVIEDVPSTHHEWAELFRRRTREERQRGRAIHEIHLDPRKFVAHARRMGYPTNLTMLERFLAEIDLHKET